MKFIKSIMLAAALMVSGSVFALTDDEQVEFASAIEQGDVKLVKKFIDQKTVDLNAPAFAWSWLQVAANKNQLPIVKLMVESGANLNYKHPITKMTVLGFAIYNNNLDMLKYLVEKGADPNIKMRGGVSMVRFARDEGHQDMVEYLMANGAKDDGCKEEKCF